MVGQAAKVLFQLAGIVILSRMLESAQFGAVAMVLAFAGFANVLGDFGFSLAALARESLSNQQSSNLFWLNSILGAAVAGVVCIFAPLISAFYALDLNTLTWVISVVFLLNGLSTQYRVLLTREGRFGFLASIDVASQGLGLVVAIGGAQLGLGAMALVLQQVTAAAVLLFGLVMATRWRPQAWRRGNGMRSFFTFGFSTTGTQLVNYASVSIQPAALGIATSPAVVGSYSRVLQILSLPLQQIGQPITRVLLPALAASRGVSQFTDTIRRAHIIFSYTLGGLAVWIGCNSELVSMILLGGGWGGAPEIMAILAVASFYQAVGYSVYWLAMSSNRVGALFFAELPGRVAMIVACFVFAQGGALAVACIVAGAAMVNFAIAHLSFYFINPQVLVELFNVTIRVLFHAALACITYAGLASVIDGDGVRAVLFSISAVVSIAVLGLLRPFRRDLKVFTDLGKSILRRKAK